MRAPLHSRETARLEALRRYRILDTPPEAEFDDITRLAAAVCETPIAVINFVDAERQWFKSEVGLGVRGKRRWTSRSAPMPSCSPACWSCRIRSRTSASPTIHWSPGSRICASMPAGCSRARKACRSARCASSTTSHGS